LGECIATLETKLAEDNSAAQARINDLEAKLAAANVKFEKAIQDNSDIQNELSSVNVRVKLDLKALEVRISHLLEESGAQYARTEDLMKSNLDVRAKLRWAKEQLRKYKENARSFYRQLTFASWAQDSGFSVGYMGGIETFRAWVKKPRNFSKVDTVSVEELLPLKGMAEDALTIG
jgi:chromosome segregation ATPase